MILSLISTETYTTCGHILTRTEHPKLIIFETTFGIEIFKSSGFIVVNMDIFTYVNSKFVYVERHVRTQINQLYRNILLQQCQLEYRMMQNALSIATRSPDISAYYFDERTWIYDTFGRRSNSHGEMCINRSKISSNHRMLRAASSNTRK